MQAYMGNMGKAQRIPCVHTVGILLELFPQTSRDLLGTLFYECGAIFLRMRRIFSFYEPCDDW